MAITYTQKLALERELPQTYKHSACSICSQYMGLSSFTLMGDGTMLCPRLKRIFKNIMSLLKFMHFLCNW